MIQQRSIPHGSHLLIKKKDALSTECILSLSILSSLFYSKDSIHIGLLTEIAINIRCFINRYNGKGIFNRGAGWLD